MNLLMETIVITTVGVIVILIVVKAVQYFMGDL